jgi:GH24 family phage-related lysozyme (muramidase)
MTLRSSDDAIKLIVTEEDSGQAYYVRHYEHFEWPLGASGPTVGIGYDCGYSTTQQIKDDWETFVSAETVAVLTKAAELKGLAAAEFVREHAKTVTITWDQAMAQFKGREMPKWEAIVESHLPNNAILCGDCFGAIVSLAYNRGPSFDAPGPHYAEMRAIKANIAAGHLAAIPNDFLEMRRLWPRGGDLWNRREHEAALFAKGLSAPKLDVVSA